MTSPAQRAAPPAGRFAAAPEGGVHVVAPASPLAFETLAPAAPPMPNLSQWRAARGRQALYSALRRFFAAHGYLEVETPLLVQAAVTDVHLESLAVHRSDGTRIGFLHTSPEYAMKRLLCAGAPDIFQVAHVFREGERVARLGAGTSVGEMAYLAPSPDLRIHSADVVVAEPATTISFTPRLLEQLSLSTRRLFDAAFIRVLVRRLHAAHEALHHPRRIL